MRVRAVSRDAIRELVSAGWVDRTRAPVADGDTLWVPVRESEPCDREIPERKPYRGRGYHMVGDIAVLQGKEPTETEINEIAGFRHPRGILWIESLQDITRIPRARVVWGICGEVSHRESGITYVLDPEKVMFSMGNRGEKARLARLIRSSSRHERVADMFAGIGYFTLPLAAAGADVHAMEINPVAFGYLLRSIGANSLSGRITASLGDCRQALSGTYDRIVMGHFDAVSALPDALRHAVPGSTIHIHSIGPAEDAIRELAEGAGFSATIHVHKVKKYRPHAWHVVQDVSLA